MENTIPDFQKIMYPLLKLLGDEQLHPLSDVLDALTKEFQLTEDQLRELVPSGQQGLFKNRVTWAVSYLKNAGLLSYPQRATYKITEAGKQVLADNITSITTTYLKKHEAYKLWQNSFSVSPSVSTLLSSGNETKTPDEMIGDLVKGLQEKLLLELLETLKSKPASFFERFVLELLSRMGYGGAETKNFEVVGKSGDNGIDGIIYQDQFGIDRVYVQAKRWADSKVQSKDIRDFIGSLSLKGTTKGIFITTSDFTEDAIKTSEMNPHNRIILINGTQLASFAAKYNVGVQVKTEYVVKALDNDFFEDL